MTCMSELPLPPLLRHFFTGGLTAVWKALSRDLLSARRTLSRGVFSMNWNVPAAARPGELAGYI